MNSIPDLPVEIAGITFKNPFYVASGPTVRTVEQIAAIEKAGWAAASLKLSIDPAPYINRYPRYALFPEYNALGFTAEKRLRCDEGLALMRNAKKKSPGLILMANITYAGDKGTEGWADMARDFQEAGADIIELNMCCPNMSFNVQTSSGKDARVAAQTGASLGSDAAEVSAVVAAIKGKVSIPLFVKLTPEGGNIGSVAKAAYAAGADAVGGTANRLGMTPINLENPGSAMYHLQDEISMACLCGPWLKPLAQRDTYEIRRACGPGLPIHATGGIRTAEDALEMAMCGGDLMGICTETLIRGYDFIGDLIRKTHDWLRAHGCGSLRDIRDQVVSAVKSAPELTLYKGWAAVKEPGLTAPCTAVCPQGIPVQAALRRMEQGDWKRAGELAAGGMLCEGCSAPCEKACVHGRAGSPVRIKSLLLWLSAKCKEGPEKNYSPKPGRGVTAKALDVLAMRNIRSFASSSHIASEEDAMAGAAYCLHCGCGEGCGTCIETCCEFAVSLDRSGRITIDKEKCVACGMCYNRCPNKNIEMVNTGETTDNSSS